MNIPNMPREMTRRERMGDALYVQLQVLSKLLFLLLAILGFYLQGLRGALAGVVVGYLVGRWMRYSMGLRGSDATAGFFIRMRERAQGDRPGALEWLLENLRGNHFSSAKCKGIWEAYLRAVNKLRHATTSQQRKSILDELDVTVKHHSYD